MGFHLQYKHPINLIIIMLNINALLQMAVKYRQLPRKNQKPSKRTVRMKTQTRLTVWLFVIINIVQRVSSQPYFSEPSSYPSYTEITKTALPNEFACGMIVKDSLGNSQVTMITDIMIIWCNEFTYAKRYESLIGSSSLNSDPAASTMQCQNGYLIDGIQTQTSTYNSKNWPGGSTGFSPLGAEGNTFSCSSSNNVYFMGTSPSTSWPRPCTGGVCDCNRPIGCDPNTNTDYCWQQAPIDMVDSSFISNIEIKCTEQFAKTNSNTKQSSLATPIATVPNVVICIHSNGQQHTMTYPDSSIKTTLNFSGWLHRIVSNPWNTKTTDQTSDTYKFANSITVRTGTNSKTSFSETYSVGLAFGNIIKCQDHLIPKNPASLSYHVNVGAHVSPSVDIDPQTTSISHDILSNSATALYFTQTEKVHCPLSSCQILENCDTNHDITSSAPPDMRIDTSTDDFIVNTDPLQEFTKQICIQCTNTRSGYYHNDNSYGTTQKTGLFGVSVTCSTNITIFEPVLVEDTMASDLYKVQVCEATSDDSNKCGFQFESYRTQSQACQVLQYRLLNSQATLTSVIGLDYTNPILDGEGLNAGSGQVIQVQVNNTHIQSNVFRVDTLDYMKPQVFKFVIEATIRGGNVYYSQFMNLTVTCPSTVVLLESSLLLTGVFSSFLGADTHNNCSDVINFGGFTPQLPLCYVITGYEIIDQNPTGFITYPQSTPCFESSLESFQVGVSVVQDITFKIRVNVDGQPPQTHPQKVGMTEYQVRITAEQMTPTIDISPLPDDLSIPIDSSYQYQISLLMIQCSTNCALSGYDVTSSNSLPPTGFVPSPVSGLATNAIYSYPYFYISVDTQSVATYEFYVYVEVAQISSLNAFTNKVTLKVVCGSETINLRQLTNEFALSPYDRITGAAQTYLFNPTIFDPINQSTSGIFYSSNVNCPIIQFEAYSDSSLSSIWADASIQLLDKTITASTNLLIDTNNPISVSIFVKASSGSSPNQSNYLEFSITVCGNEKVWAQTVTYQRIVGQIGDSLKVVYSEYHDDFQIIQADDDYCKLFDFGIKTGALCDQPTGLFNFDPSQPLNQQDILIDTSTAILEAELCIDVTTKGQSTGFQKILVEICGNEDISLVTQGQAPSIEVVSPRDSLSNSKETISVTGRGYTFQSSSVGCDITSYSLQTYDSTLSIYSDYTGTDDITLDSSNFGDIKILYGVQNPLLANLFLKASQQSGQHALLPIKIEVCGFESIKVIEIQPQNYTYPTNLGIQNIKQSVFENYFVNNGSSECFITSYKLISVDGVSDYVDTDYLKFEIILDEYQMVIDTGAIPDIEEGLEEIVFLQAVSAGEQTAQVKYTFTFVPNGINSAPIFCSVDPYLFFEISAQYAYSKIVQQTRYHLPEICDPDGDSIQMIDPEYEKAEYYFADDLDDQFRLLAKKPAFFKITNQYGKTDPKYQLIEIDTYEGEYVEYRQEGYYKTKQYLEDSKGNKREVQIDFVLVLFDLTGVRVDSAESLALVDFRFVIDFFHMPLKKVTEASYQYNGDDPKEEALMNYILFGVIQSDQPKTEEDWQADFDTGYIQPYNSLNVVAVGEIVAQNYLRYMNEFNQELPINDLEKIFTEKVALTLCGLNMDDQQICDILEVVKSDQTKHKMSEAIFNTLAAAGRSVWKDFVAQQQVAKIDFNYEQPFYPTISSVELKYGGQVYLLLIITFSEQISKLNQDQLINSTFLEIYAHSAADFSYVKGFDQEMLRFQNETNTTLVKKEEQTIAERDLNFKWKFYKQSGSQYYISIDFDDPLRVSASQYGKDQMSVQIVDDSVFTSLYEFKNGTETNIIGLNETSVDVKILSEDLLRPMIPDIELEKDLIQTINRMSLIILLLQANLLLINILLSKSLQDLWGMLNTQQITIHLMLFKCQETLPGNVYVFNSYLSQLNQKDMYPTDIMFEKIFNFTDTESPNEHFETLGYEGHNFIDMTGSVLINIALAISLNGVCQLLNIMALKCRKFSCARKIGSNLKLENTVGAIFIIYLQGFLEISLCCIIALTQLNKEALNGSNVSDLISSIFALISGMILVSLPFVIMRFVNKNSKKLYDQKMRDELGYLYTGLAVESRFQSSFHAVYMIRRLIFVNIIVFYDQDSSLQLIQNLILTILYIIYIQIFKPFSNRQQNKWEVFNELNVVFASYALMWLIQGKDLEQRFKNGWAYIVVCSFSLLVNALKIAYNFVFRSLPQSYRNLKSLYEEYQYIKATEKWMEEKINYGESLEQHKIGKVIIEIMQLTLKIRKNKKNILEINKRVFHQKTWLQKNNYEYKEPLEKDIQESSKLFETLKEDKMKVKKLNKVQQYIHEQMVDRNKNNKRHFDFDQLDYQSYVDQILQEAQQRRAKREKRRQNQIAQERAEAKTKKESKKSQERKKNRDKTEKSKSKRKPDPKIKQNELLKSQRKTKEQRQQMLIEDGPIDFDVPQPQKGKKHDPIKDFIEKDANKQTHSKASKKHFKQRNKSVEMTGRQEQSPKKQRKEEQREKEGKVIKPKRK